MKDDAPGTDSVEAVKRVEFSVWELVKLVNNHELLTQLGVVAQGTKEGKAYYQGQYDMRREITEAIRREFATRSTTKETPPTTTDLPKK